MRVTVLFFARLRDLTGRGDADCALPEGATIADAWRAMVAAHPALAPHASSVSASRNARFAPMTSPIADGDEIAFLPPVSGG